MMTNIPTTPTLYPPHIDLDLISNGAGWNTPLLPRLIVSREADTPAPIEFPLPPLRTPVRTGFNAAVKASPARIAASAFLRSPVFLWQDVKAAPIVSAGLLAGLGIASYAGVMNDLSPWILAGGTATAGYLTAKGALGLRREIKNGDPSGAEKASRDFGIGAFGLAVTAATLGIMAGLEHFGILSDQTEARYGGLLRALAALLHSPDEIALGLVAVRGFLGRCRTEAGKEHS